MDCQMRNRASSRAQERAPEWRACINATGWRDRFIVLS